MVFAVTGANGFLGVHIIHHLLKQQQDVLAIKRETGSLDEFERVKESGCYGDVSYEKLRWFNLELYDTEALFEVLEKADYVIHTAGLISYKKKDLNNLIRVNKEYTAHVVNMALLAGVKKIVYCGSIAAIQKQKEQEFVTEDNEWDNEAEFSNYGLSKYLGECEIWRGIEEGLPGVIVNPGVILGYGDWNKGSNKLFKNAFNEFKFYSTGKTGFVGVRDVAQLCYMLCVGAYTNERYILVAENKSYEEVTALMAKHFGKKPPSIAVQGVLYKLAYWFFGLAEVLNFSGLLTRETVKASVARKKYSNEKIREQLSFTFRPIDQVIEEATLWYKKSPTAR